MNVEDKYRILRTACIKMIDVPDTIPQLDMMAVMAESLGADEPTIGLIHALSITHEDAP